MSHGSTECSKSGDRLRARNSRTSARNALCSDESSMAKFMERLCCGGRTFSGRISHCEPCRQQSVCIGGRPVNVPGEWVHTLRTTCRHGSDAAAGRRKAMGSSSTLLVTRVMRAVRACGAAHIGLLALSMMSGASYAQETYPSRPIRIIVPTAPGGSSDLGARLIGEELQKRWGKPVVVELRAGAGTIVGSEMVAKAAPDGYTLLMSPSTLATNPTSYK